MNPNRATAVAFAFLATILATVLVRARGPSPLPENAPAHRFSAQRAISLLHQLLGGDAPHPVGAPTHDAVRDRIAARLRQLGFQTSVQQRFACNAHATCAPVANILARMPGDARADTLLLSAHYDSVPAGPGATDDGVGVATLLEIARAIRNEHFRNAIVLIITDGEEAGLLGAEGFIADPVLSRGVAAVINIDNRGTSGRSYLFETSRHNRWLLPLIARGLPNPATSSLFYNLYLLLPNDTDLTAFRRAGIAGINFACIGGVAHYHTPLDNLRHVMPSTVQDHGDHILGMTRTLANTDLRQSTNEDAVFFDVLSLGVVWWPQSWTMRMAAGALLVLLVVAGIRIRDGETTARAITAGVISFFLSVFAAALLGALATWIASLRSPGATWLAQPGPIRAAMWLIGIATAIVCATLLHRRAGFDGLFIGHGLCWTAIGVGLTIVLPGGSYLAVVPAMAFAAGAALRGALSAIIVSALTATIWFPIVATIYDTMGRPTLAPTAAILALISTTFTPIAAGASIRRAAQTAMSVTAVACLIMQLLIPAYTPESPRRINVEYIDEDGESRWQVDALTPQLAAVAPFSAQTRKTEWLSRPSRAFIAPAPQLPITPPELQIVNDDVQHGRHLTLRLRSTRGAEVIALVFRAPNLVAVRINGVSPPQHATKSRTFLADGWHSLGVRGAQQAEIEIILRRNEPIEAIIGDRSFTLPADATPLTRARDASPAVPSNDGDGVRVRRRIRL